MSSEDQVVIRGGDSEATWLEGGLSIRGSRCRPDALEPPPVSQKGENQSDRDPFNSLLNLGEEQGLLVPRVWGKGYAVPWGWKQGL